MRIVIALSICLLVCNASFSQTAGAAKKTANKQKTTLNGKSVVSGHIKNMRNKPVKGIEAFIYKPDSSIIASGITDSAGFFETNGVVPGPYFVKLVYPSRKVVYVTDLKIAGDALLNLKADEPEADTAYAYEVLMPKVDPKKDKKKK